MSSNIFQSELKSIKKIIEEESTTRFNIPVYQRPYVWSDLEINKLLEDIRDGFKQNKYYFIGNVYVSKNMSTFDVIDGQQRFTTIWLIAFALKEMKIQSALFSFLGNVENLRLGFTIRTEIENYLKTLLRKEKINEDVSQREYLKNIAAGLETIKGTIGNFKSECEAFNLSEFGNYINEKVTFVFNIAPENTNLNDLFIALGNSGIQLEQSDILKSQLLKKIEDKVLYSKIWEACENMNDYFEHNVLALFTKTVRDDLKENDFAEFKSEKFGFELKDAEAGESSKNGKSISEIVIQQNNVSDNKNGSVDKKEEKKNRCRSIIDFNLLLIHTLRISLKQKGKEDIQRPLDKKNLIEIFKELEEKNINEFLLLLWKVRFQFDKYVIKWRFDNESDEYSDDDEKLRLTFINQNGNSFARQNKPHSELSKDL